MKRNFLLLAIFVLIAGVTYLIDETGFFSKKDDTFAIFSPSFQIDTLQRIDLPEAGIKHEAGLWFTIKKKFPVTEERMEDFFNALSAIKVRRIFNDKELASTKSDEMFAANDPRLKFTFKSGILYIRIGKKIPVDDGFYVEVVKKEKCSLIRTVLVAHDSGPRSGVYLEEGEWKSAAKYIEFLNRVMAPEEKFMDTRAIRKNGAIKKVLLHF